MLVSSTQEVRYNKFLGLTVFRSKCMQGCIIACVVCVDLCVHVHAKMHFNGHTLSTTLPYEYAVIVDKINNLSTLESQLCL